MKEYKIYEGNNGLSSLFINVFDSLRLIKMTQTSPLGYSKGTMTYLYDFLDKKKIDHKGFNLQIDIAGGFSTDQELIIKDAINEFELIFDVRDFLSVNIFDTFGGLE